MSEERIMLENRELLPLKARIQLMEQGLLQEQIPKTNWLNLLEVWTNLKMEVQQC